MVLKGKTFRSVGEGVALASAVRIASDLGATTTPESHVRETRRFDDVGVTDFGDLSMGLPVAHGVHAVHAVGGALMAQWSVDPGPVLLTTPYAEVSLGAALPMLALAQRLGYWHGRSASCLQGLMALQSGAYSYGEGRAADRWSESPRGQHPSYSLYECRDGWIFLGALSLTLALKAFAALKIEDRVDSAMLTGLFDKTSPDRARVGELLSETLGARLVGDVLSELSAAGVPASDVPTFDAALNGALFRGFEEAELVTVQRAPAPSTAQVNFDREPLRVLEVAGYISGPFVGRLMTDFGASVKKVEPLDGDPLRRQGLSFAAWNHGKTCLPLDLGTPVGQTTLRSLIREADVVVTNYLPKSARALGLDADAVLAVNPTAIVATIGGYPAWSGLGSQSAFDPAIQATFGIMRLQGGADEPVKPQIAASDYVAAMLATSGILAALHERRERGTTDGYRIDTSLAAAGYLLARGARDLPEGRIVGGRDFRGRDEFPSIRRTLDGWILVSGTTNPAPMPVDLGKVAAATTTDRALRELGSLGYAAAPCYHPDDLPSRPDFRSADVFHVVHEESGNEVITPRLFGMASTATMTQSLG